MPHRPHGWGTSRQLGRDDRTCPTPNLQGMTTHNIGTPQRVPVEELNLHPQNPRQGDTQAIKDSMLANGVFNPLVVNKGDKTGRPMEVLAGNHRLKALRELAEEHPDDPAWGEVDVYLVDVDEERATKILLSDNRTSDFGTYDDKLLLEMLETVDHDLDGTGYDYDNLEDLMALNSDASDTLRDFVNNVQDDEEEASQGDEEGSETEPASATTNLQYEEYLAITFSVTAEERNRIRIALNHIKTQHELETQAQALVWLIEHGSGLNVDNLVEESANTINAHVADDTITGGK